MKDFFVKYWLECLFSGILSVFGFLVKVMFEKVKRLSLVERGMQALLKDRIIHAYNHNIKQGYCPIYLLEGILDMYEQYHALGGNGTVTRLVKELEQLPTQAGITDGKETKCKQ